MEVQSQGFFRPRASLRFRPTARASPSPLPLTLPFALVSLLLFEQALDIDSMLGLLVLSGVLEKNAIDRSSARVAAELRALEAGCLSAAPGTP